MKQRNEGESVSAPRGRQRPALPAPPPLGDSADRRRGPGDTSRERAAGRPLALRRLTPRGLFRTCTLLSRFHNSQRTFLTPPVAWGADLRAALVASCLRGAWRRKRVASGSQHRRGRRGERRHRPFLRWTCGRFAVRVEMGDGETDELSCYAEARRRWIKCGP